MSANKQELTIDELGEVSGGLSSRDSIVLSCIGCGKSVEIEANQMVRLEYEMSPYVCPRCSAKPSDQWPKVKEARKKGNT